MLQQDLGSQLSARKERLRQAFLPERAGAVSEHFRTRRWAELCRRFPDLSEMSIIDLGGYGRNWNDAPLRPKSVLVVNLDHETSDQPDWIEAVRADACALPAALLKRRFDLVYSNSLLEHVGGYGGRSAIASAVHQLADHHWVQTPYRYFPVEPHWVFPGFQFLPVRMRAAISRSWPLAATEFRSAGLDGNVEAVLQVELLSATEMRHLFPGSEIYRERVGGLTKSIIAVL